MLKFVLSRAQDYFTKLTVSIAQQIIEMDTFARSAQNEATNRERLLTMIDTHLDYMHYANDILTIKNEELVTHSFALLPMKRLDFVVDKQLELLRDQSLVFGFPRCHSRNNVDDLDIKSQFTVPPISHDPDNSRRRRCAISTDASVFRRSIRHTLTLGAKRRERLVFGA